MNLEIFKQKKFLDGDIVVALDCTLENYKDMVFLQKMLRNLGKMPCTDLQSADSVYEMTKTEVQQMYEQLVCSYPKNEDLVLYVYCIKQKLRLSVSTYLYGVDEIYPMFDELVDCSDYIMRSESKVLIDCNNHLITEINKKNMRMFCESNGLLVLPYDYDVLKKALSEIDDILMQTTDASHDLYLFDDDVYKSPRWFVRIRDNRARVALLDVSEYGKYTLLFDDIYFLEAPASKIN